MSEYLEQAKEIIVAASKELAAKSASKDGLQAASTMALADAAIAQAEAAARQAEALERIAASLEGLQYLANIDSPRIAASLERIEYLLGQRIAASLEKLAGTKGIVYTKNARGMIATIVLIVVLFAIAEIWNATRWHQK